MKTRKTFGWLMLAACLFVMGSTQVMADDKKDDAPSVPIPLIISGGFNGGNHRGLFDVPFTAYYQEGVIYINTSAEFSVISLYVENEVSGQEWNSATDISDGMGEICIFDGCTGSYTIEIITEYGECFTGSFRL